MNNLTLHIIANPKAGSGNAKKALELTKSTLNKKNIAFNVHLTEYPSHERKIAKQLVQTTLSDWEERTDFTDLLLIIGGDGTLHQVVNALHAFPNIPIAYLPAGSGNDFARGLSLTRKVEQDLERILLVTAPSSIPLIATDFLGNDGPKLILNNIGIGLDAHIVNTANHSKAKNWLNKLGLGSLTYLASVFSVLKKQKAFPVTFETNNKTQTYQRAYLCTLTNHPFFGGGVAIDPTADIKEMELSVVLLEKVNIFLIIYLVIRLFFKKHLTSKYIHHFKTTQLTISTNSFEYCQTDGEIVGNGPQKINCQMTTRLFWL